MSLAERMSVTDDEVSRWLNDERGLSKSPPWHIEERAGKYIVILDETGKVVGTHDTKEEATAHLRALYANAT